ncbi:ABC transporter permease subunit [Fictibacillus barbaricus]|uniref:ABC transporter permease subunit n=1 Tax=Fictibacillus barbaricus TaxID=182136 RepID=A0ABS2ZB92_9BACL|nr:ABC transporter permease subunit [Fictibacillus barbaricus]MBN3544603.1 ABC transporter permease subunit [Fictibacillus barbaricus]GGB65390.1 acetoin ABC transporter permease [Fictibacillus barbaricus]
MFHKALWMRNQKLASPAVWAVYLSLFFLLPFTMFGDAQSLHSQLEKFPQDEAYLSYSFQGMTTGLFLSIVLIGFAALLIGLERSTHSTDLTFSLPFKRKDIYLSKWMFGVVHITTALLVNLLLCMLVVRFTFLSEIGVDPSFLMKFMILIIPYAIAIFTFCMFIGTISGSIVSQFILSSIFLFFPIGFFSLLGTFLMYHGIGVDMVHDINSSLNSFGDFMIIATLPAPIFEFSYYTDAMQLNSVANDYTRMPSYLVLLSPLIYLAVTFPLGIWLFNRTKNENNGRLLVFEKGKGFFSVGVIVCFALAFGMIGGGLFGTYDTPSLIGYYISAAIGGVLSYAVLRKLMNMRFKLSR